MPQVGVMEGIRDVNLSVSFQQVAHLLEEQHAIITGGRSREGCPIITFPDTGKFLNLSDENFALLISYLTSVPSLQDIDMGFVLVIDRRHDKWSSVKATIAKISGRFPALVRLAFVLRPTGLLQKAICEVSQKFSSSSLHNDDFAAQIFSSHPFKIVLCNGIEDLKQHLDAGQLTSDLGGTLPYSHSEWMQHRLVSCKFILMHFCEREAMYPALEKFDESAKLISRRLQEFSSRIRAKEVQPDIATLRLCLENESAEQAKLNQDLESAVRSGETLLALFREPYSRDPAALSRLYPNRVLNVASVQSLLLQLEETQRRFCNEIWTERKSDLVEMLECLKYELQVRELVSMLKENLRELDALAAKISQAETFAILDELSQEFVRFRDCIQDSLLEGEELETRGWAMAQHAANSPVDRKSEHLVPICTELGQFNSSLKSRVAECDAGLVHQRQLLAEIQEANEWCSQGVELLAAQQVEKYASVDFAQKALSDLEKFLEGRSSLRLIVENCGNVVDVDKMRKPSMVRTRMEDILTMCEKRRVCLKRLSTKPSRPVQTVHPTTASPVAVAAAAAVDQVDVRHGFIEMETEQYAKDNREINVADKIRCISVPMLLDSSNAVVNDIVQRNSGSKLHSDLTGSSTSLTTDVRSDSGRSSWDSRTVPKPDAITIQQTGERKRKRSLVVKELVDTERVYVAELDAILRGYREPLVRREMQELTPAALSGRADVLFGNLEDISAFHRDVFLLELEASFEEPCLVAKCFMQRKDQLYQLYTKYCRNKPSSEDLRRRVGDSNPFFLECQRNLGHKLPLSAYLLKPVQRVTKYQLLLKDLVRYSDPAEFGSRDLAEALDAMLGVLKSVNDSMHQVAILGFPMTLLEQQGRMLLNGGPFHVWITHREQRFDTASAKSGRSRLALNLLPSQRKPKSRHLFLYEKALLFCKQVPWPSVTSFVAYCGTPDVTFESPFAYEFKHYLNMSEVGMTEKVGRSSKKFELWVSSRHEVYVLQAPSADAKAEWVREIKRVLFEQLQNLRGKNARQYSGLVALRRQHSAPAPAWDASSVCSSRASSSSCSRNSSCSKRMSASVDTNRVSYVTAEENEADDDEDVDEEEEEEYDVESSCLEEESDWETDTMASGLMGFEAPRVYVCLADYSPLEPSEVDLVEGEVVEVVQTGGMGWCYVKSMRSPEKQGWAPMAYLGPVGETAFCNGRRARKSSSRSGRRATNPDPPPSSIA
ncbi:unnamed protein product [Notodromas monacha]|uniref:Guanine nucleotide exchange factor DBS n=1 Tax=Notodromas monacha TaxID=399045 RepID=A0A7R9BTH2_9CRUS|nr:unnamed protein product [Notodromas monacha]CAG0921116.1 unnamed protein product [Notodromas monacha]